MEHPCMKCETRKLYAKCFDKHIFGEDCPYFCPLYEKYMGRWERDEQEDGEC